MAGYIDSGGFVDNLTTGSRNTDASKISYVRGAIGFDPNERLSILANVNGAEHRRARAPPFDQINTPELTQQRAVDGFTTTTTCSPAWSSTMNSTGPH